MTTDNGSNLIFLISQPRAGSTLLQRILAGHPLIHSPAEPWLILPLVYALRPDGHAAEYNSRHAQEGIEAFCNSLDGGIERYYEGARRMALHLYDTACQQSGKSLFLDKTPRYYLIVPELARTFPAARFIILFRNPLAVLSSVLETWVKDHWILLSRYRQDILAAPSLLVEGARLLGERAYVIRYEDLVTEPETSIRGVCGFLEIDYSPEILEYGRTTFAPGEMGDPTGIYRFSRPSESRLYRWQELANTAQAKHLYEGYLKALGPAGFTNLGYDYDDLQTRLKMISPVRGKVVMTWDQVFDEKSPLLERRFWIELALIQHRRTVRWLQGFGRRRTGTRP